MTENEMKRAVFDMLLPQCPYLIISQFDKTAEFPEELKHLGPNVVIRFGRTKGIMEMPDLVITDKGLSVTISIQGFRRVIRADWESVMQLYTLGPQGEPECVVGWSRWIQGKGGTAKPETPAPEPRLRLVKSD
jgi:hypothetical protein